MTRVACGTEECEYWLTSSALVLGIGPDRESFFCVASFQSTSTAAILYAVMLVFWGSQHGPGGLFEFTN